MTAVRMATVKSVYHGNVGKEPDNVPSRGGT